MDNLVQSRSEFSEVEQGHMVFSITWLFPSATNHPEVSQDSAEQVALSDRRVEDIKTDW